MSVPYGSLRPLFFFVRWDESASETKYGVSRIRSRPDKLLRLKRTQALGVTRNQPRAQTSLVARNCSTRLLLGVSFSNLSKLFESKAYWYSRNRIKRDRMLSALSANSCRCCRCQTLVVALLLLSNSWRRTCRCCALVVGELLALNLSSSRPRCQRTLGVALSLLANS